MRKLLEEFTEIRFAAASLAFSTLLSLIPFLIVVLAVFQSIGGLETFYPKVQSVVFSYFKEATGNSVTNLIRTMINQVHAKPLGLTGISLLILTSLGLFRSIDIAFHRIWKLKMRRSFLRRLGLYAGVFAAMLVVLSMFVGVKSIEKIQALTVGIENSYLLSMWITFFLLIIYKAIPDTKVSILSATIAAGCTGLILALIQGSFFYFARMVFQKNKIYGSLISFPIFLIWLYVVWCVVLGGVSFCAFIQRKIAKRY